MCETYWYPLYAYVRRRGQSPEDAQDLTQQFFAQLLEHNWLARADPYAELRLDGGKSAREETQDAPPQAGVVAQPQ